MGKSNSSSRTEKQPFSPSPFENSELKTDTPEPTADELGRLRDILFGSQSRTLEKRLGDLGADLHSLRQEMTDLLHDQIGALSESTRAEFVEIRREFNEKLDKQSAKQVSQLQTTQKQLSDSLENLAANLIVTHKELGDRLDKQSTEQVERTRDLQSEICQRDEDLRQELLSMVASLDSKKASRQDLSQMLMELGLRLQQESKKF